MSGSAGADGRLVDIDGRNAMHWAAYHGCHKIIKLFVDGGFRETALVRDKEGTQKTIPANIYVFRWCGPHT